MLQNILFFLAESHQVGKFLHKLVCDEHVQLTLLLLVLQGIGPSSNWGCVAFGVWNIRIYLRQVFSGAKRACFPQPQRVFSTRYETEMFVSLLKLFKSCLHRLKDATSGDSDKY